MMLMRLKEEHGFSAIFNSNLKVVLRGCYWMLLVVRILDPNWTRPVNLQRTSTIFSTTAICRVKQTDMCILCAARLMFLDIIWQYVCSARGFTPEFTSGLNAEVVSREIDQVFGDDALLSDIW